MSKVLALLLLSCITGCSLKHGAFIAPVRTIDLHVINKRACPVSFEEAQAYLLSHGILLRENIAAKKALLCLVKPWWIVRQLSPVFLAGVSDGQVAWAIDDTKVILHELGHDLFSLPHQPFGLMFPLNDGGVFATGFTDTDLIKMRGL